MAYAPDRGDIIHLDFDPASGNEMSGKHFALVVSARLFNNSGLAMVCPISQGASGLARSKGFLVSLMGAGTESQGNVHCHQLKSLDWRARRAVRKESVPTAINDEVAEVLKAILFDE
jgi:mRNA interferase ChpB